MNPVAVVAGRQVLVGRTDDAWRRGGDPAPRVAISRQIVAARNPARNGR
jgi:hypothetical protein